MPNGSAGRGREGRRGCKGGGVVERIVAEVDAAVGPRRFLGLGKEVAGRDRLLGPGLEDSRPHGPQIRVLLVSRMNERVEGGISEDVPPVAVSQLAALDAGVVRLDPFGGDGRRRPAIVRPDLEAVVNPGHGVGRDAAAHQQDRDHTAGRRKRSEQAGTPEWGGVVFAGGSPCHVSFPRWGAFRRPRHESSAAGKSGTIPPKGNIGPPAPRIEENRGPGAGGSRRTVPVRRGRRITPPRRARPSRPPSAS